MIALNLQVYMHLQLLSLCKKKLLDSSLYLEPLGEDAEFHNRV